MADDDGERAAAGATATASVAAAATTVRLHLPLRKVLIDVVRFARHCACPKLGASVAPPSTQVRSAPAASARTSPPRGKLDELEKVNVALVRRAHIFTLGLAAAASTRRTMN